MRLFRKFFAFLGYPDPGHNHHEHGTRREEGLSGDGDHFHRLGGGDDGPRGRAGGFRRTVLIERTVPVIVPCENGDGGIQGFDWYREKLKIDEDGDVADEFLYESPPRVQEKDNSCSPSKGDNQGSTTARLEVNHRTCKVPIIGHPRVVDGNVQHCCMEQDGKSRWV